MLNTIKSLASNVSVLFASSAPMVEVNPNGFTLYDMQAYCEAKKVMHPELEGLIISFDNMDKPHSAGYYSPRNHQITITMSARFLQMEAEDIGLTWQELLDAILCHELGHAVDPQVPVYATLMDNARSNLEMNAIKLEHMMQLEKNAYVYGKKFVEHHEAYEIFNQDNLFIYEGILAKLKGE